MTHPDDSTVVHQLQVALVRPVADAVSQVYHDGRAVRLLEAITVHRGTRTSRHLSPDAVIVQHYAVVARGGLLRLSPEMGRIALACFLQGIERHLAHNGHQHDIAHVRAARAAQMGVAESPDDVVVLVVARTMLPSVNARIRADLNHTEGSGSPREGVTRECRPDERINILRKIVFHI